MVINGNNLVVDGTTLDATELKTLDSQTVQTIAGIKTFTSSPVVPTPMAGDSSTKVATTAFVLNNTLMNSGFKNLIINGCLRVNQRGASSIDATASAYNFDRWYYDGTNFIQFIEDKNIVLTGTYTLSWVGTATAKVNGVNVLNGGQITLTANTQVEVKFNSSDFNLVQLEYGSKKTNFEIRPYSIELSLCDRYFKKVGGGVVVLSTSGFSILTREYSYDTSSMRIQPSYTVIDIAKNKSAIFKIHLNYLNAYSYGFSSGQYHYFKIDLNSEIYPI